MGINVTGCINSDVIGPGVNVAGFSISVVNGWCSRGGSGAGLGVSVAGCSNLVVFGLGVNAVGCSVSIENG